ncbi:urease accessory protein UreD [Methylocella silvestris]|uniref:Urease accessory protein UreD n=1 Tax=Methylocella silvestris TaxID=199596 RepID=A0A2J7TDN5_METSI|nr:urease accessory protein UreD [Methylocella silvestris]PNG24887.1 urease accessory protein [Methylocella silvestris]
MSATGSAEEAAGRRSEASLVFAVGGGRTFLQRQRVPYPCHITRPFWLDADCPDLATLYLQSASGGLYRGDHLRLLIEARPGARAHVTTQSATVVHDTGMSPARQETCVAVGHEAFCAVTPDPFILFPNAELASSLNIVLGATSRAIVAEGFACHDPAGNGRAFSRLELSLSIRDEKGGVVVAERSVITGLEAFSRASPLGPYRAYASMIILGPADSAPDPCVVQRVFDDEECLAGVSRLPGAIGLGVRVLAPDGGRMRMGLQAGFNLAFRSLTGVAPARRRK